MESVLVVLHRGGLMRQRVVLAAASLMTLAACMAQTTGQLPTRAPGTATTSAASAAMLTPLAGTYTLSTIDGQLVPFAPIHPGQPANSPPGPEVLSSTLLVHADGKFIMSMSYRARDAGKERYFDRPFSGSWVPDGAGYLMTWDGAGQTSAKVVADTLAINNEGMLFKYRKRR